jgi:hypothetical protein
MSTMMNKMFGTPRAAVQESRLRDKSFANLSAERDKTRQQIATRESTISAIENEVRPLLVRYQELARAKKANSQEAQLLLARMTTFDKRLQEEKIELQTLKGLDRLAEMSVAKAEKQKTTNGMLSALEQVAPYLEKQGESDVDSDRADEIISRITGAQLDSSSSGATLSQSLARNLGSLDADTALTASAMSSDAAASTNDTSSMLARLGGQLGVEGTADGDEDVTTQAADAEAERLAAAVIAAAEEAERRRTVAKKNAKVDAIASALLAEAQAKADAKASGAAVKTRIVRIEHDVSSLDALSVPNDTPASSTTKPNVAVAEALLANGRPAGRRMRHNFVEDDDEK